MTDGYIVVEEDEDLGDSNDTLESSVLLHEIYGEEVFNKADDLIDDAPSLPNATQGTPLKKKRRRLGSRQLKFKRNPKGRKRVIILTSQKQSHERQKSMPQLLSYPNHCMQIPRLM
jgi:hypothetical protein